MFVRLYHFNRVLWSAINPNPGAEKRSDWLSTWGFSALVHAFLFGLLALITLSNPRTPEFIDVLAEFPAPEPVIKVEQPLLLPQIAAAVRGMSAGGRAGTAGPVAAGIETAPEQASRQVAPPSGAGRPVSLLDVESRLPSKDELASSSLGTKLGKGLDVGGGSGGGVGEGEGNGSGFQFFELATAGTKYVYVIDGSGSMTEPHKEARTKLDRVKEN